MTELEAARVLAEVLAGTVQRDRSKEDLAYLRRYLLPLPYEQTLRRVEEYVASVGRGRDGKATHGWISTPGELLEACGLPDKPAVRADLVKAMREGGELLPDLRSMDGWSYVPPGAEMPIGVLQAEAVARESFAPPRQALPPPLPKRPELAAKADQRIRSIADVKRVQPVRAERKGPTREQLEAELARSAAAFDAELQRAKAMESGELSEEEMIPW